MISEEVLALEPDIIAWRRHMHQNPELSFQEVHTTAYLTEALKKADQEKRGIAAICAAPSVLGDLGFLKGKKAVCYPGFESRLTGAEVLAVPVVTDGHITTSRGMGTAIAFALELTKRLKDEETAMQVGRSIIYNVRYGR